MKIFRASPSMRLIDTFWPVFVPAVLLSISVVFVLSLFGFFGLSLKQNWWVQGVLQGVLMWSIIVFVQVFLERRRRH